MKYISDLLKIIGTGGFAIIRQTFFPWNTILVPMFPIHCWQQAMIIFNKGKFSNSNSKTKRGILAKLAKIYDPLGIIYHQYCFKASCYSQLFVIWRTYLGRRACKRHSETVGQVGSRTVLQRKSTKISGRVKGRVKEDRSTLIWRCERRGSGGLSLRDGKATIRNQPRTGRSNIKAGQTRVDFPELGAGR